MRKILLFLSAFLLLLALTPVKAEANLSDSLRGQDFYGLPVSMWGDEDYYSNPYPFGTWYGVNNLTSYDPFGYWYGVDNFGSYYDPFGSWSGVRNTEFIDNPFGSWSGVRNTSLDNPFGTWNGVRNTGLDNPFGTWTGVRNTGLDNPFGQWSGVDNSTSTNNPFGSWSGVNNSTATNNPFGSWSGTNNMGSSGYANSPSGFDANGYQTNRPQVKSYQTQVSEASYTTYPALAQANSQYFVAPRAGVSKTGPFVFAGLITLASIISLKRKAIAKLLFA